MSVESLLREVSAELKAVRAARERYAVNLSPDFNCFDYIEPNELRLSQILADLLNPRGSHAQGGLFLDAFLRRIGLDDWIGKPVEWVKREDLTTAIDRDRRVDILIHWQDGRELAIENKPWANDSKDQLLNYIEDLEQRKVVDWHVVYLGGTSAEPDKISLGDEVKRSLGQAEKADSDYLRRLDRPLAHRMHGALRIGPVPVVSGRIQGVCVGRVQRGA